MQEPTHIGVYSVKLSEQARHHYFFVVGNGNFREAVQYHPKRAGAVLVKTKKIPEKFVGEMRERLQAVGPIIPPSPLARKFGDALRDGDGTLIGYILYNIHEFPNRNVAVSSDYQPKIALLANDADRAIPGLGGALERLTALHLKGQGIPYVRSSRAPLEPRAGQLEKRGEKQGVEKPIDEWIANIEKSLDKCWLDD
jgi:hypothetical protein